MAITRALIQLSNTKNCQTLYLISTDLGAPVYEKAGFIVETDYLFFKDINFVTPLQPSKIIVEFREDFRDQIIKIDKLVSSEDRVLHFEEHLKSAYVYLNNNIVEGWYLPYFGEGLIIAVEPQAGIELMKLRLLQHHHAAFPVENVPALAFFKTNDIAEFKSAKRMQFGIKRKWQPEHIYNRIGGNLG